MSKKELKKENLISELGIDNQRNLEALRRLILRAKGFTLVFARCNSLAQRDRLVSILNSSLPPSRRKLLEINLDQPIDDLLQAITERLQEKDGGSAIFVYGLEKSFHAHESPAMLQTLNLSRELFPQRVHYPLVIWLPEFALRQFILYAPDFWAWRSDLYNFTTKPEARLQEEEYALYDRADALILSLKEKQDRIEILQNLLSDYQEMGEGRGELQSSLRILESLASIHYSLGEYSEAEHSLKRSISLAERLNNRKYLLTAQHNLGIIEGAKGDYKRAEELYQMSLNIYEELGDKIGISKSLHQLGIISHLQGDYRKAEELYQKSLSIAEELGDKNGIAGSFFQLGIIKQLQGDYPRAEEFYRKSLRITEELGDKRGIAKSLHQLGIISHLQGDYPKTEELYQESLRIKEELGDKNGIAKSLHQLGRIKQEHGDYKRAEELYQKSLSIAEELGDKSSIAINLHQLGRLCELKRDFEGAMERYIRALAIFEKLKSPYAITAKASLARIRKEIGDKRFRQYLQEIKNKVKK